MLKPNWINEVQSRVRKPPIVKALGVIEDVAIRPLAVTASLDRVPEPHERVLLRHVRPHPTTERRPKSVGGRIAHALTGDRCRLRLLLRSRTDSGVRVAHKKIEATK